MNFRHTSHHWESLLTTIIVVACWLGHSSVNAVEPLAGPAVGARWWKERPRGASTQTESRERLFDADIPVPISAVVGMPFLTVRYRDHAQIGGSETLRDERYGGGLMHHAAEGEPAWRFDMVRLGGFTHRPSTHTRIIGNLSKRYPWLKLRPSDELSSWIGLHVIHRTHQRPLMIPELSWQRIGVDGLIINVVAPRHAYVGLKSRMITFTVGAEQEWQHWHNGAAVEQWTLQRTARLNLAWTLLTQWTITTSILHDLRSETLSERLGAELTLRWNPGA
jgi:hypothetical protein